MAISCTLKSEDIKLAEKVVDSFSEQQLENLGINAKTKKDAISAIAAIAATKLGHEEDIDKREAMYQNINWFQSYLDSFLQTELPEEQFSEAQKQYDEFLKLDFGRLTDIEPNEGESLEECINFLSSFDKVIELIPRKNDEGVISSVCAILKKPVLERFSKQDKALQLIDRIRSMVDYNAYGEETSWVSMEIRNLQTGELSYVKANKSIPDGWGKTGRQKYRYNGQVIVTNSVSNDIHGFNPDTSYPILAAPIGTFVDRVGRDFFDKQSQLWENGKLKDDTTLREIIDSTYGSIFTLQGLKNLLNDFQALEKQFNERWGQYGLIKVVSGEVHLFGKNPNGEWIQGKPDLIVIDGQGTMHIVDFKTYKMTNVKNYQNIFGGEYGQQRQEDFGKQESRYIRMMQSYGANVDENAYVVLIDTWYDSSDFGTEANRQSDDRHDVYSVDSNEMITIKETEETLGEYAERAEADRNAVLDSSAELLYIEPRLHVKYNEETGISDELHALRDDIPFDTEKLSYEAQWEEMTEAEKSAIEEFAKKPIHHSVAQGVRKLSSEYIDSRPELLSSQEIQYVADHIMYNVSDTLNDLARGRVFSEISTSGMTLKGKAHDEIIRIVGIDNLINMAFSRFIKPDSDFPSEEDYKNGNYDGEDYYFKDEKDYYWQKRLNDKRLWLSSHKQQLIETGYTKLMALEKSIIPVKKPQESFIPNTPNIPTAPNEDETAEDNGDNEAVESFIDSYLEGLTDVEAWMLGQRNYSPKASLAQEIKRMFENIILTDENGKIVKDPYGWGFAEHLDATQAIQMILDTCKACETIEEMLTALENMAKSPKNAWVNTILNEINARGNENLKKKFFKHFRKDALTYSISQVKFDKQTGKRIVETRVINMKSVYETITQSLGASFRNMAVGNYQPEDFDMPMSLVISNSSRTGGKLSEVADYLMRDIQRLEKKIEKLYDGYKQNIHGDLNAYMSAQMKEQGIIDELTSILQGVGIMVPSDVVYDTVIKKLKGKKSNNARTLLRGAKQVLTQLNLMGDNIPLGLKGNKAFRAYKPLLERLADSVQEHVEASVYQDGKTYYSYTNPSRIGHIIRNLRDDIQSYDENDGTTKFANYIKDNFGRYTGWFKTVDGSEWLNDWIGQLVSDKTARTALGHKVELTYLGNQYRNLGALGFQLSILHNYFGTSEDKAIDERCRWFALPTMSNKPTNEFIRMLKYKDEDEIVNRVLMKTFQQELNRMADVLYHYTHHTVATDQMDLTDEKLRKAGWDNKRIRTLKGHIDNHTVSVGDLVLLSSITSGAKFHFLWYLNNEIANNEAFAAGLVSRLNKLLSSNSPQSVSDEVEFDDLVRSVIRSNMQTIVENELSEMERIGLFDTEQKKMKVKGKTVTVEVPKYQEEFNGNLGDDGDIDTMKERLRDFIWQDIAANINIIQITGGDLAYYGNAVNYQKRIAQIHSPGLHLMHDDDYDDGFLRSVHVSDEKVISEVKDNAIVALEEYMQSLPESQRADYKKMISIIASGFENIVVTDGQSFSSPTSVRKKLALQGEWDDQMKKAYDKIREGDFNINHLGIMLQPSKPFVTSDMAKYSGSPTMEIRRSPLQDKNSEYLILLAEALSTGAGKESKLAGIYRFMEDTAKASADGKRGIDTVHFASVGKVGVSGVIDISGNISADEVYDRMMSAVKPYGVQGSLQEKEDYDAQQRLVNEGKLKPQEVYYNSQYVDTIPVEDYIIQQEVPAHLLEHEQLYGSQIRILGISDISPTDSQGNPTVFNVKGQQMTSEELIKEYKDLHATNIREAFSDLMDELGIKKVSESIDELPTEERNKALERLEYILQKELAKDSKYGIDVRRACTLQVIDNHGNKDFVIPLMDPIQSKRIQMLLNSIIKKSINKQRINGGPVVQTTAYDADLHIVFKDKRGNILSKHYEDFNSEEEYKEYLKKNQAGIAYFECYMPVPNATLEKLMIKEDGSMMTIEELQKKLPKEVWDSMSQIIGYRIPTEDKYSMIPLKIKGFVPKAAGQVIMMPKEITYLTGSDFDIDKMYLMMKAFDIESPLDGFTKEGNRVSKEIQKMYFDRLGEYKKSAYFDGFNDMVKQVMRNAWNIVNGNNDASLYDSLEREGWNADKVRAFVGWYRDLLLSQMFSEFKNQNAAFKKDAKRARDNRLLDLQWAVLTHEDTAAKMLNPGNFNEQKKVGRIIKILKEQSHNDSMLNPETGEQWTYDELSALFDEKGDDALDRLLENTHSHSIILPSSKIYFQRQNMQGTQMVGIFANNNVSHAFLTFQRIGIDLTKGFYDNSFTFDGVEIGNPDHPNVLDAQRGFNGQLISKTIASFLAASVDTAKDPTLSDMNVNTFTGGVAMVLVRLGFDTAAVGLFLSQPVILQLSDLYFKNKTEGFYDGETALKELSTLLGMKDKDLLDTTSIKDITLSKENFIDHIGDNSNSDFQKRVLRGFYQLYRMAKDLQELTFCTKFNSVSNAAGPTIADTIQDSERVRAFMDSEDTNCFYVPTNDNSEFTSIQEVIESDPILKAFFETTVASDGASERIFKTYFPHYYEGFRNVLGYFKDNYLKNHRVNSKLYNQLLDEYIYYMLTYQGNGFRPVIPSNKRDKDYLITGLVGRFEDVLKIKGRKPNAILDQGLGNNCLMVRRADEYLPKDTLVFNGGQLNSEGQDRIKNAWSDLITMQDPNLSDEENSKLRRFGVDLFFYTLMRNGFGFSPKTLMHLASTVVRYNATWGNDFNNYIIGLRNLHSLDSFLAAGPISGEEVIKNFLSQFIRNHSNNRNLVPNIDIFDSVVDNINGNSIEFGVKEEEEYKLHSIMIDKETPCPFITVTRHVNGSIVQQVYEREDVFGSKIFSEEGKTKVRYHMVGKLGLNNNFIEYDANTDLQESYFDAIRKESEEDTDVEMSQKDYGKDNQDGESQSEDVYTNNDRWVLINRVIRKLEGPQADKTSKGKEYRNKLKAAYQGAVVSKTSLAEAFDSLLDNSNDLQSVMDSINEIFIEQDKC